MSKAILDTTILVDAILKTHDVSRAMKNCLSKYESVSMPAYALKEYREGALNNYIWLYNKVIETSSMPQLTRVIQKMRMRPNTVGTAFNALADAEDSIAKKIDDPKKIIAKYGDNASYDAIRRDEIKIYLKKKIFLSWKKRRSVAKVTHELECFDEDEPEINPLGMIDLPRLKCTNDDNCCMIKELKTDLVALEKMKESLKGNSKRENVKRYQVLKKIIKRKRLSDFNYKDCLSVGDAAFAFYCENDEVVLTTNIKDHVILTKALGKRVETP